MPDATTYVQKKQTTILCKMKDQAIGLEIAEMANAPNSPPSPHPRRGRGPSPVLLLHPARGHVGSHVPWAMGSQRTRGQDPNGAGHQGQGGVHARPAQVHPQDQGRQAGGGDPHHLDHRALGSRTKPSGSRAPCRGRTCATPISRSSRPPRRRTSPASRGTSREAGMWSGRPRASGRVGQTSRAAPRRSPAGTQAFSMS